MRNIQTYFTDFGDGETGMTSALVGLFFGRWLETPHQNEKRKVMKKQHHIQYLVSPDPLFSGAMYKAFFDGLRLQTELRIRKIAKIENTYERFSSSGRGGANSSLSRLPSSLEATSSNL